MSTTITIRKDPVAEEAIEDSEEWSELGNALGYPDSWIAYLRESFARRGKTWHWKAESSPQSTEQDEEERTWP